MEIRMIKTSNHILEKTQISWPNLFWLPIPIFLILIVILAWLHVETVWAPPVLIPTLNIFFITIIMLFVSILAARNYLHRKSLTILLLGTGTLALGLGGLLAGFSLLENSINSTVTIYNSSACLSGFCILLSAIFSLKLGSKKLKSNWPLLASYIIIITLISVLVLLVHNHFWPVYFIQGTGPTFFDLAILYTTITLFAISSILLLTKKDDKGTKFNYWYGLGLGLIAIGLFGVSIQMNIGDPLNWVGRISQYFGCLYILIAVILSIRYSGIWMLPWEQALYEIEEKYHSLYNSMNEGVALHKILYNEKGKPVDYLITDVNPSYEDILGLKKDEVIGRRSSEVYGINKPPYLDIYSKVAETGNPENFETYYEPMNLYFNISVFSPKKGEFATIFEDISKRKQIEKDTELLLSQLNQKKDELSTLIEKLEKTNKKLYNEIHEHQKTETKLEELVEELKRSNEELQQFANVASHDLQEPLRMVSTFTQLLEQRYKNKLDEDADEFIHYAVDGAKRMQQLINGLLTYSRVTTKGKKFEVTDCNELLERSIGNLRISIAENDAQIVHDPLPTIMADPQQIIQVFQNLISNAIKFRSKEPPKIHISAQKSENEWIFQVSDNGIGIDSTYHDRIFVIFQRLHKRDEYPGTGMGLAICQKIIERHKGHIWVDSELTKGSKFYFTIPLKRESY
jgi:signal transduction histidine kinase